MILNQNVIIKIDERNDNRAPINNTNINNNIVYYTGFKILHKIFSTLNHNYINHNT